MIFPARTSVLHLLYPLLFLSLAPAGALRKVPELPPPPREKRWPAQLGSFRAVLEVRQKTEAALARIPWRRRDRNPEQKAVLLAAAASGKEIPDVVPIALDRERGVIAFRPANGPGRYYLYFLPFQLGRRSGFRYGRYLPPKKTAGPAWLSRNHLTRREIPGGKWKKLPEARVLGIQARTEFDRRDPMEVVATAREKAELLAANPRASYLVFPEDRRHPIRMKEDLPLRWIEKGPSLKFEGRALRGEYYVFQLGLYAARRPIRNLALQWSAPGQLKFHCFNLGGFDYQGRPFKKAYSVEKGKVGALWIGVPIPEDLPPGPYGASVLLRPEGAEPSRVAVKIQVLPKTLEDGGDGEGWRLSRLRWLESRRGLDEEVTAPYTPVEREGTTVKCLGREVRIGPGGLPTNIRSNGMELLAGPIALAVETREGTVPWKRGGPVFLEKTPATVSWKSRAAAPPLRLECLARMEFDGFLHFELALSVQEPVPVRDIRLEIPLRREAARYMMGMGKQGGFFPGSWKWKWNKEVNQDSLWLGCVRGGLQCKLKGPDYVRPLVNVYYHRRPLVLPDSWSNGGKGGCTVGPRGKDRVLLKAYSGPRTLVPGRELRFDFDLLVTPVKPIDYKSHWKNRYYHRGRRPEPPPGSGVNVVNVHQGNELNPYINYPLLTAGKIAAFAARQHRLGRKVKLYYTVRELTNHLPELWALRSLGDEIFFPGTGGGYSWLREHLDPDYVPAWYTRLPGGGIDASLLVTPVSRWDNFYVEELSRLLEKTRMDGLYIDDVAYGREVMKRVRRVLQKQRPGSLIDFHSWNHFNKRAGFASSANLYMELFPYIDRLWFGEGFDYNKPPDYWLVEISGIPFGLMGEMLQGGGNQWRGMLYGMTTRLPWSGDPRNIWKVWDDFGIQDSEMLGYWDPGCPVRTGREDVLATVYRKKGKSLVALASWAKKTVPVRLRIDWNSLGLSPGKARLFAPEIPRFQGKALFRPGDPVPVPPGKGWLLVLEPKE